MNACPDEWMLWRLTGGSASVEEAEDWRRHLAECALCRTKAVALTETPDINEAKSEDASVAAKADLVRYIEQRKSLSGGRRGLRSPWFWVSIAAWILSFFITKYFLQFLFLALLAGTKWIIDERKPQSHLTLIRTSDQTKDSASGQKSSNRAIRFFSKSD